MDPEEGSRRFRGHVPANTFSTRRPALAEDIGAQGHHQLGHHTAKSPESGLGAADSAKSILPSSEAVIASGDTERTCAEGEAGSGTQRSLPTIGP
ncbi:hypothetical protein CEP52_001529 [Fusarium oligoseptatum]|uniref:Uncharacterized protein n=2 Tax=Fusarium solani species complex TaxID=232080 RepID=A0A428UI80_9HYPO|nr:hypothetical protein CDV31_010142 [Fusarium ambrosium]RSM13997.1 hypothetical protein CEP52_001529 [Fusarium oligoseptatum]